MSAARRFDISAPSQPEVEAAATPEAKRAGPSAAPDHARPASNPLATQHRMLAREFHIETTDVEVGHYPAAVRLGIIAGGAVLGWAAVAALAGVVVSLL
jgi:hypothetical protein